MRRWPMGALLALAALAGCTTGTADGAAARPNTATDSASVATAPRCEVLPDHLVPSGPEALPPLTLDCLGPGPDVSLAQLTGPPTLVNLWATWCLPCREEMPLLQDAFAQYGEQVGFLGVDTQDSPEAAASFVADLQIEYPHVLDPEGELLAALGVRGLPVTLAVDRNGLIVARSVGQLDPEKLQQLVEMLTS